MGIIRRVIQRRREKKEQEKFVSGAYIEVSPITQQPTGREYIPGKGFIQSTDKEVISRAPGGKLSGDYPQIPIIKKDSTIAKIPESFPKTMSSQQLQQIQKPYGTISSATPNLDRLRKLNLKRIKENLAVKVGKRVVQFRREPLKTISELQREATLLPFKALKGVSVVTRAEVERRTERLSKLQTAIEKKKQAGKVPVFEQILKAKLGAERGILRATSDIAGLVSLVPKLPEATYFFLKNQPISKTKNFILNLPSNLKIGGRRVIQNIKNNPTEAVSYVMTQYFLFGGKLKGGKNLKPGQKIEKFVIKEKGKTREGLFFKWTNGKKPILVRFRTKLNTNIKGIKTKLNKFIEDFRKKTKYTESSSGARVRYMDAGKIDMPSIPPPKPSPKVPGRKGRNIELTFRSSGWDTLPLKQQAKFIGKKLNLVSAQAERLIYLLRRSRKIQKPIAGLKLSKKGISLLNKLNLEGGLTKAEVKFLNTEFRKTKKGLLAKSFFASPSTNVRVSRLGLRQGEAGLIDIFRGNFSLKRNKPQILFFRNQRIQQFPKELKIIKNKLSSGRSISNKEALDLLNFQLKKSGRFKPIGYLTREAEVTLAPGEIIHRVKRLGSVRIVGRKVPIVEAEVIKVRSKLTRDLMNRLQKGTKLSKEEVKKLNRGIEKESGFKSSYSSYSGKRKPYLNLKSKLLSLSIYYSKSKPISYYPKVPYKGGGISGTYPRGRTPKYPGYVPPTGKTPPYIPKYPTYPGKTPPYVPKYPQYPRTKPPVRKVFPLKGKFRYGLKKNAKTGYYVYGLFKGKYLKLNRKPLLKIDALSRGSYAIDRTTAKTFKIVPITNIKRFGVLLHRERGYFTQSKSKFREYKIKKGKRYVIVMKFIEKRRYGIDTTGEKQGLTLARYLSKLKKQKKY